MLLLSLVELPRSCDGPHHAPVVLLARQGYLAPLRSPDVRGRTCPWKIQASPGQRVNISVLELTRTSTAETNCPASVTVVEGSARKTINLCSEPNTLLYSSRGSSVTIETSSAAVYEGPIHMVFKYQGNLA